LIRVFIGGWPSCDFLFGLAKRRLLSCACGN